jgi:hypothetical protein
LIRLKSLALQFLGEFDSASWFDACSFGVAAPRLKQFATCGHFPSIAWLGVVFFVEPLRPEVLIGEVFARCEGEADDRSRRIAFSNGGPEQKK